jgi:CRP-like cAMP-binding protein
MDRKMFHKGALIFREGDMADCMYAVYSGRVGVYAGYGTAEEKLLAEYTQDQYFGEMGLAECYPRSATAVAKAATTVSEIDADEFASYFKDRPDVVLTIMRALSARLRETDQRYLEAKQAVYDAIEAERAYDIDCPALLLCGEKDRAGDVRPFNRKWTAGEGIPLVWVPGAGHNSNVDAPDFVNAQIERFVATLATGGRTS